MKEQKNYTLIDEKEVPGSYRYWWDKLFEGIPKGKALVINNKPSPQSVRKALKFRQRKGKFTNLVCIQRGEITYVLNPEDKEIEE